MGPALAGEGAAVGGVDETGQRLEVRMAGLDEREPPAHASCSWAGERLAHLDQLEEMHLAALARVGIGNAVQEGALVGDRLFDAFEAFAKPFSVVHRGLAPVGVSANQCSARGSRSTPAREHAMFSRNPRPGCGG